jgi:HlyD family secretion protein
MIEFGLTNSVGQGIRAACASALLFAALLAGCGRQAPEGTPKAAAAPEVPVIKPARQTLVHLIEQPGFNRPYEQTPIYSKIAGYVQEVNVDIGKRVHKGDLLLRLWVPEMEQDLEAKKARVEQIIAEVTQAEEGLRAAEASVDTAEAIVKEADAGVSQADAECRRWQAEYERAKRLVAGNIYDKQTLEEALNQSQQALAGRDKALARVNSTRAALAESKAKRAKAQADVAAIKAKLQVAEREKLQSQAWLDYRDIRAPYDGVITLRRVHTGHFLQSASSGSTNKTAEPLFVVMSDDQIRVTLQVPENDAALVKDGMPAAVRFQAIKNRVFKGTVTRSSASLDEHARTLRTEIQLENPDHEFTPGMFANVTIAVSLPNVLTLPNSAIVRDGDQAYCYRVEDGKALRTDLSVGVRTEQSTVVLKRLKKAAGPGTDEEWEDFTGAEEIVAKNPGSLIDGQEVRVAK